MYQRDKQNPMKDNVEFALAEYAKDINNIGAGYSILRYAERDLLKMVDTTCADEFLCWYPRNPAYAILRMAAKGNLTYKHENVD